MSVERLRIMLHPFLFFAEAWNGIDEHLLHLCRHLSNARFEPVLLVHETDGPQTLTLARRAGIRAIAAPYGRSASAYQRCLALRRLYSAEGIDILHLNSPTAAGMAPAVLAGRLANVKAIIATYHLIQGQKYHFRTRTTNRAMHHGLINAAIAVSMGVKETLVENAGVPANSIRVIYNGVELPESVRTNSDILAKRHPGEVRLGYFGRLSPEKGVADFLLGLRLVGMTSNVKAYLVGDGPQRPELEMMVADLGLMDRVTFMGYRPDARAIMQEVDIVVHVPRFEGLPLAVLEAMAAARPVIANDSPGAVAEAVINEETGLIVQKDIPEMLAEAILRLANNPEERLRFGANGSRRAKDEFSAHLMATRVASVYERVLG